MRCPGILPNKRQPDVLLEPTRPVHDWALREAVIASAKLNSAKQSTVVSYQETWA